MKLNLELVQFLETNLVNYVKQKEKVKKLSGEN